MILGVHNPRVCHDLYLNGQDQNAHLVKICIQAWTFHLRLTWGRHNTQLLSMTQKVSWRLLKVISTGSKSCCTLSPSYGPQPCKTTCFLSVIFCVVWHQSVQISKSFGLQPVTNLAQICVQTITFHWWLYTHLLSVTKECVMSLMKLTQGLISKVKITVHITKHSCPGYNFYLELRLGWYFTKLMYMNGWFVTVSTQGRMSNVKVTVHT